MSSILVLMILILSCLGYGLLGLRLIGCPHAPSWGEDYGRAFALGMGTLGWLVFWFGISGFLQSWILWLILVPGVLIFVLLHNKLKICSFYEIGKISWMLLIILIFTVSLDLLEALAPPADADTLAYHYALPKQFFKNGVIEFVPIVVDGAIPLLTHMTYILALGLGGETSLTLWSFTTQFFLVLALYGVGRRWLSREWSLVIALVLETSPAVIYGGGSGHMEIRTALYMLIGAIAIAEGTKQKSLSLVILAGLMAGFFMSSKYFGLFAATGIGTVILFQKNFWRTGIIFSSIVFLSGTQWYGWNLYHTGMPVFPTMYNIMGSPISQFWNEALEQAYDGEGLGGHVCVPANLFWFFWYPVATTFNPENCFDSGRIGLGLYLWFLLPGLFFGLWHYRSRFKDSLLFKFSIPAVMYYILWFFIPANQMTRHLLPIFPILLVSTTVVIYHLAIVLKKTWWHVLLKMSATICILIGLGIQSLFMINYLKYHFLQETRDVFYLRNVGRYNLVQWINQNLTKTDRIGNPIRYLNYLLEVPYIYLHNSSYITNARSSTATEKIIRQLKAENISHIINWNPIADILVRNNIFKVLISFDTVTFHSRTLGIPEKSKSIIFRINNEIK